MPQNQTKTVQLKLFQLLAVQFALKMPFLMALSGLVQHQKYHHERIFASASGYLLVVPHSPDKWVYSNTDVGDASFCIED